MRRTDRGLKAGRRAAPVSASGDETAPSGERFDAFMCYKRIPADERFVDHLCRALAEREPSRTMWVDRTRIEPAVDWLSRVTRGIDASRALIYVITPESVASEDCRQELDLAIARNKLIVPVLLREVTDRSVLHPRVSRLNWIPAGPGDDQARTVDAVARALEDDLDWRDEHTYLGASAGRVLEEVPAQARSPLRSWRAGAKKTCGFTAQRAYELRLRHARQQWCARGPHPPDPYSPPAELAAPHRQK